MKPGFLLLLLSACGAFAIYRIHKRESKEAYWLFGFCVLLFSLLYSVAFLNLKISGSAISIEAAQQVLKAREEVLATRDEVNVLAVELLKTSSLILDGAGRFGGVPESHQREIRKHTEQIEKSLTNYRPNLRSEIQQMVSEVNRGLK